MTPGERSARDLSREAIKDLRLEWWRWRNLWRYLLMWLVVLGVPYTLGAWWHGHGRGWLAVGILLVLVGGVAINVSVMVDRRDWDGLRWGLRFRVTVRALERLLGWLGVLFVAFLGLCVAFAAGRAAHHALGWPSWAAVGAFFLCWAGMSPVMFPVMGWLERWEKRLAGDVARLVSGETSTGRNR